jgi:hypothetical protein
VIALQENEKLRAPIFANLAIAISGCFKRPEVLPKGT